MPLGSVFLLAFSVSSVKSHSASVVRVKLLFGGGH
jgi:hypothetical protein